MVKLMVLGITLDTDKIARIVDETILALSLEEVP